MSQVLVTWFSYFFLISWLGITITDSLWLSVCMDSLSTSRWVLFMNCIAVRPLALHAFSGLRGCSMLGLVISPSISFGWHSQLCLWKCYAYMTVCGKEIYLQNHRIFLEFIFCLLWWGAFARFGFSSRIGYSLTSEIVRSYLCSALATLCGIDWKKKLGLEIWLRNVGSHNGAYDIAIYLRVEYPGKIFIP